MAKLANGHYTRQIEVITILHNVVSHIKALLWPTTTFAYAKDE